jgi:hypothetical protein
MARKNVTGISFLGLELDKQEEKELKEYLKKDDFTGKQLLRKLVRGYLKTKRDGQAK